MFTVSPPQSGTKQHLADNLHYVKDIRAGVRPELKKGTNPFAISSILKLDKYKDWAGYDTQFGLNVLYFVIEEGVLGPYAKPLKKKKKKTIYTGYPKLGKWRSFGFWGRK